MSIKGYKDGKYLIFDRDGKRVRFDLSTKSFFSDRNGRLRAINPPTTFFSKLSAKEIAEAFEEEAYGKFILKIDKAERRCKNVATLLNRLADYKHLEGYLLLGIDFTAQWIFKKEVSHYTKEVREFMRESRIVFSSSRWEDMFVANTELFTNICAHVRRHHHMDLEVYRFVYAAVIDYSGFSNLLTLVNQFGCEYKTLLDFLFRADRLEAVEFKQALTLLKDYLNMNRLMGKTNHEKYPRMLRSCHDIVARNYRTYKEEFEEEIFAKCVDANLAHVGQGWRVLVPTKTQDVKDEGTNLNHCVGSYIRKILDGTTQIVFLREKEEESLVTVEVRGGQIVQARGQMNRDTTPEEKRWLRLYAAQKELQYDSQGN